MRAKTLGKSLNCRELNSLIHPLRFLDNRTNLLCIVREYLMLAIVLGVTIGWLEYHAQWGWPWYSSIPVVALAVCLTGAGQHRLAGLGHEGAHYILMRNRVWNELVSDSLCMFPLFATTEQYRQIHLGHHEYTNDWEHDPELLNLGRTRRMADFPMTRWQFFYNFGLRLFWPPTLLRYLWDNIYVTALGRGVHPYMPDETQQPHVGYGAFRVRVTTVLGIGYVALMAGVLGALAYRGPVWLIVAAAVGLWLTGSVVVLAIPDRMYFQSKLRPIYSNKITSVLRIGWITGLQVFMSIQTCRTGFEWGVYFYLLWVLPMMTIFPYLMLLRDLFQHANADDGKLTNSRVMFCNPVLRWAMFVYGQDAHLTHHLYPAVPHYNLPKLHRLLQAKNDEYAQYVVECHGLLRRGTPERPSLLDVMQWPTREPSEDNDPDANETPAISLANDGHLRN